MPAAFESCVHAHGRVRTVTPKSGTYIHVCFKDGKSYAGEVHHKKAALSSASRDTRHRKKGKVGL